MPSHPPPNVAADALASALEDIAGVILSAAASARAGHDRPVVHVKRARTLLDALVSQLDHEGR